MPSDIWAVEAANRTPESEPRAQGRLPGRPRKRWAGNVWTAQACNVELWTSLEYGFGCESI
eukprot:1941653-Pyramimonas_sp.AAC.1